jgi:hypothetical protein
MPGSGGLGFKNFCFDMGPHCTTGPLRADLEFPNIFRHPVEKLTGVMCTQTAGKYPLRLEYVTHDDTRVQHLRFRQEMPYITDIESVRAT